MAARLQRDCEELSICDRPYLRKSVLSPANVIIAIASFCRHSQFLSLLITLGTWNIIITMTQSVGSPYRNDKVVTTLAQPWHKVATMLFYNLVTTLAQPWHNLGTTLYFETVARL